MTDVHDVYVEKRRWRFWPIVVLILVGLFLIGFLVAMIMNIHGSISWPAGEVKFGFWPTATTSATAPEPIAPPGRIATEIAPPAAPAPAPQVQPVQEDAQPTQPQSPPATTPPIEPNTAEPAESAPP